MSELTSAATNADDAYRPEAVSTTLQATRFEGLVGELLGSALANRRVQAQLEQQLHFETMIGELSASLVAASVETVQDVMTVGLRRIAEFLHVDRSSVFEVSPDGSVLTLAHAWAAPGVPIVSGIELGERFPWIAQTVRRGQVLSLPGPDALPV